jgi:hypothetical protein
MDSDTAIIHRTRPGECGRERPVGRGALSQHRRTVVSTLLAVLRRWAWFSDPSWPRRAASVSVLLGLSAAVLRGVARLVDFPDGYNGAQSSTAGRLAERPDQWSPWRRGATRDLAIFIPAFVGFGAAVLAWAIPGRRLRVWAISSLVAAGVADVVETVLFRGTLDRFRGGATAAELSTRTTVTRAATVAKYSGFVGVGVALALVVAGRGGADAVRARS